MAASDVWLFRPTTAYRVRPGSDQATFVPRDEPLAANPPDGAVLDFYLKEKAASPIQLEIFNSEGKLVRQFASDDELRKTDPRDVKYSMEWVRDPQPLSAEAGMHRFVWDLGYAVPKSVRVPREVPVGVLAPPGQYIVKLTANGKSTTQPLTVKMDPRVKTPQDALVRQFELASRIAGRLGEVSRALQQVSDLRKQIEARKKEASGHAEVQQALEALAKNLEVALEPDRDASFELFGLAVPGKEHVALQKVSEALLGLLVIVESADVRPTADATAASEKWDEAALETLGRWESLQKEDLERVNALLEKAKLKLLTIEGTKK
jgi:hypothetical protein